MAKVKKGDFVEVEYTGKLEDGTVFDTTNEKLAKDNDLYNDKMTYGPMAICIGESHILKGLDKELEGREPGISFTTKIKPDDAFGKKSAKLLRMIPGHIFKRDNVPPQKGMQVNIDGAYGTVINVSGGRVIVDFNHPLAGKIIVYDVKLNKIIEGDKNRLLALVKLKIGDKIGVELDETTKIARVEVEQLPKEIQDTLKKEFTKLIPGIKDITFEKKKEEKKAEEKKEAKAEKEPKEAKNEVKEKSAAKGKTAPKKND